MMLLLGCTDFVCGVFIEVVVMPSTVLDEVVSEGNNDQDS